MRYKVGDKVRIRKDLIVGEKYSGEEGSADRFVDGMAEFLGKEAEVTKVTGFNTYKLNIGNWHWTLGMLEDVKSDTKFKVGDKLNFVYAGEVIEGVVEYVGEWDGDFSPDYYINGKWYDLAFMKYVKVLEDVEEKKFDYSVGEIVSFVCGTETIKGRIEKIEDWYPLPPDYYINGEWYDEYEMHKVEVIKEDEFEESMSLREEVDHDQIIKDFLYEIADKLFELWKED